MLPILQTNNLSVGYFGKRKNDSIQRELNLSAFPKDLIAVAGPNGCGKSTLLRTLCGLQKPLSGSIRIEGTDVVKKSVKEKAKIISLVLTEPIRVGGMTVADLISTGRFPYTGWAGNLTQSDKEKVAEAVHLLNLEGYEHRFVTELSDGERQRVLIAKALAQDTPIILLDEPTAHLDLNNRIEIITLLRNISINSSKAVIFSTHELDLALNLTNRIWLMNRDLGLFDKTPQEIIAENILEKVFHSRLFRFDEEGKVVFFQEDVR